MDGTQSGTTNPGQDEPASMSMKGNFTFPKDPELEPHHHIVIPAALDMEVSILCRDAVGLFYCPNRLSLCLSVSLSLSIYIYIHIK